MNIFSNIKNNREKVFLSLFFCFILFAHSIAYVLYVIDIPYYDNDLIRQYQFKKIKETNNVETIFVGDSSLGRGISAKVFNELSDNKGVMNLALTGSYGFIGSLNMVKQARLYHPEIKNIVFIQTLYLWSKPFSIEGFFKTEKGINSNDIDSSFFSTYKNIERLKYMTDFKRLYRFIKYIYRRKVDIVIEKNDYAYPIVEGATFHNGEKVLKGIEEIPAIIRNDKKEIYKKIDSYCGLNNLNCIFLNGPIHETVYKNTDNAFFDEVYSILSESKNIYAVQKIFSVDNDNMGNNVEHVDLSYKDEMTRIYFNTIEPFLK